VRVRGLIRAATGVGIREYANMLTTDIRRRGRINIGRRMRRPSNEDKQTVPKSVVVACTTAAVTISLELGEGSTFRWKYHWETVAAVVVR
jgi:hypothetical protein